MPPRPLETDLHVVRAGHVRSRPLNVVSQRALGADVGNQRHACGGDQIEIAARRAGVPSGRAACLRQPGLILVGVVFRVVRITALDEQLVADRGRPLGRRRVVSRRIPDDGRRVVVVARGHGVTPELVDFVPVGRDLVARAHLPCQASQSALDFLVINPLFAARGRLQAGGKTVWSPVAHEGTGNGSVHRPLARRAEEPQPVAQDRPAFRNVEIVNPVDGAVVREPPVLQILREIVGLPFAISP